LQHWGRERFDLPGEQRRYRLAEGVR
jgi:hypothetical protein